MEQVGLVPAPLWDAGAADKGLTGYVTAPAPNTYF